MKDQPCKSRLGVFVCHCGHNIASRVRIDDVVAAAGGMPEVVVSTDNRYLCSEPGQRLVRETIVEKNLDAVVVASCSPRMHERTFRRAAHAAGMNPYRVEIANIREQCSWIHSNEDEATGKAIRIVGTMVEKVRRNRPLEDIRFPVTPAALVVGGGIAGIQAALDIAEAGHRVYLVEKQASIGGNMARLSETFPTLDCAQCTLTPKMVEVSQHPNVEIITGAEVESVEGYVGNFMTRLRERAKYVDWDRCTGCGTCIEKCPVKKVESEFDLGLGLRRAIFTPFPQAVPNKPTIDREHCRWFGPPTKSGKRKCGVCARVCSAEAIRFDDEDKSREIEVGAIVIATGFETYDRRNLPEYGGGALPDVIDGLQFERLLSASGPTAGELLRPSDGKDVQTIAFVQCAGSRDAHHKPYCSKVCCMYTSKHALLFKHKVPDGEAFVFYIDLRHGGRDYEEFLVRTQRSGARFIRGKVAGIEAGGESPDEAGKLLLRAEDTLSGTLLQVPVDLVVLATAMEPTCGSGDLARKLKVPVTGDGFFAEAHLKLRPVESPTAGFFLAGAAQGPRDIAETVAQAGGAAAKVLALLAGGEATVDPTVAIVREEDCIGCGHCIEACPADARVLDVASNTVQVTAAMCLGCGACAPACPTGAADMLNFSDDQFLAMVDHLVTDTHGAEGEVAS